MLMGFQREYLAVDEELGLRDSHRHCFAFRLCVELWVVPVIRGVMNVMMMAKIMFQNENQRGMKISYIFMSNYNSSLLLLLMLLLFFC